MTQANTQEAESTIKNGLTKHPTDALTLKAVCEQYPIGYDRLRKLCKARQIVYYQEGGETSKIYFERKDVDAYFFSDKFKQITND